jgi:GH18 family chitinase
MATQVSGQSSFKVVGYVANWINLNTFSNTFDFNKVTHLNLAFKNPNAAGVFPSMTLGEKNLVTKAHQQGVKVLLAIGGGTVSGDASWIARYDDLMSSTKVSGFAGSLTRYCVANQLDGIDVDLEGNAIDENLYGPFIEELYDSLKKENKLLTCALSQGYGGNKVPSYTFYFFDWINIMAYDATGPWGSEGHHSSYAFAVSNLNYWKNRGLPASKCILGLPFYGYGFGAAFNTGGYTYKDLVATYPGAAEKDTIGATIYYNGKPNIRRKTELAMNQAGGVMIWELSQDASGENSLLSVIAATTMLSSTAEYRESFSWMIYPQPAQDYIRVQTSQANYSVELWNVMGELVWSGKQSEEIPVQPLPAGTYVLVLVTETERHSRRIAVQ